MAEPPYFGPKNPGSGELSNYSRDPDLFWFKVHPIVWEWAFAAGYTPPGGVWPSVRMMVDGSAVTSFVSPATNSYVFNFDVPNGHHVAHFDGLPVEVFALEKEFLVNSGSLAVPNQASWTTTFRFEVLEKMLGGPARAQATYPGQFVTPTVYPLKPRSIVRYTTRLSKSALWVRRVQNYAHHGMVRGYTALPTGDVVIERQQKWDYGDSITQPLDDVPEYTLHDGPRHQGAQGVVWQAIITPDELGYYATETNGRVWHGRFSDGMMTTVAGWRTKLGILRAHSALLEAPYNEDAFYASRLEYVGNWSAVPAPQKFWEPHGTCMASDGRIFVADTRNNRILKLTIPGAPNAPTGPAVVTVLISLATLGLGAPGAQMNEPWGLTINPAADKLYWTNFGAGTVCRANLDGTGTEVVFQTAYYPSDVELQISSRLFLSNKPRDEIRAEFHADGPPGTFKLVRPQAIDFDSNGTPFWSERYSFTIRKGDLTTGAVSTHVLTTMLGGSLNYDVGMVIDREGTVGPQNDIFVTAWGPSTDFRYDTAGVMVQKPFSGQTTATMMSAGPLANFDPPSYCFCMCVEKGRILVFGNAAGMYQMLEITFKLSTDPTPTSAQIAQYRRGKNVFCFGSATQGAVVPMALLHGHFGHGLLGKKTIDEMGALDDASLRAYGLANGIQEFASGNIPDPEIGDIGGIDDFIFFVRWLTQDVDYSSVPPVEPPVTPPGAHPPRKTHPKTRLTLKAPTVSGGGQTDTNTVPAWRRGMQVNEWKEIPGTTLQDMAAAHPEWFETALIREPPELQTPESPPDGILNYPFQDYVGCILASFCGMSIDTRNSSVYVGPGGGHNDYYGNQTLRVKLSSDVPVMEELVPTSPGSAVILNARRYADGRPGARHSCYAKQFVERLNRDMSFGSHSMAGHGGAMFSDVIALDPDTRTWSANLAYPDSPITHSIDGSICKDPRDEKVYIWEQQNFMVWNPNTTPTTWRVISTTAPMQSLQACDVDTRRNRIVYLCGETGTTGGGIPYVSTMLFDIATETFSTFTLTGPNSGNLTPAAGTETRIGMVFFKHPTDPAQDCFLLRKRASGNTVYRVNAVTWFTDVLPVTGGSTIPVAHFGNFVPVYNRFIACPQYGGIVYAPRSNVNWWFLRTEPEGSGQTVITGDGSLTVAQLTAAGSGRVVTQAGEVTISLMDTHQLDTICFYTWHATSSYEREQKLVELNGDTSSIRWRRFTGGAENGMGFKTTILEGQYNLLCDGAVNASVTMPGTTDEGTFTSNNIAAGDGWHTWVIERVGHPEQETIPWTMYVNRSGGPVAAQSLIPVVAGSFDTHEQAPFSLAWISGTYDPPPRPLTARECPEFSNAEVRTNLYRTNIVPVRFENINRISKNARGVMGTFNRQCYYFSDMVKKTPLIHLLDGPRSVGNLVQPTHIFVDRHGGAYCLDPWRVARVHSDGTVSTRCGYRHKHPPSYHNETPDLELIGDWSAIPSAKRGFHETWGGAFDINSLALDPNAPPQFNSINGQMEQPHLNDPRMFVTDTQNNRVILLTFQKASFSAVPRVTEFLVGLSDPWDVVWTPGTEEGLSSGVIYVSERQASRLLAYNAVTGALIRVVLSGSTTTGLTIDASRRVSPSPGSTGWQSVIGTARAQPVVNPDGIFYQDGYLYYGSASLAEVRRVNLTTGVWELVARPAASLDGNSHYFKFSMSDGTFGPRGTIFVQTFSLARHGYPEAFLPNTPGTNGTHSTKWDYFVVHSSLVSGKGGAWRTVGYGTASGVGKGRLYFGSSQEGLVMISKALPADVVPNATQYANGFKLWRERGFRPTYGDQGYSFHRHALPWGQHPDIDYFLTVNGHTP